MIAALEYCRVVGGAGQLQHVDCRPTAGGFALVTAIVAVAAIVLFFLGHLHYRK